MFEALLILYIVFNVISLLIVAICCASAIVGNSRLNKLATAKIALPTFTECRTTFIQTIVTSAAFLLLDWLLFANDYVSKKELPGVDIIAKNALSFAVVWAVALALVIILEMVIVFSKNKKYQVKDVVIPVILTTVGCFILTFIVA